MGDIFSISFFVCDGDELCSLDWGGCGGLYSFDFCFSKITFVLVFFLLFCFFGLLRFLLLKNEDNVLLLGCVYFEGKSGRPFSSYSVGDFGVWSLAFGCIWVGSFIDPDWPACAGWFGWLVESADSFTLSESWGLADSESLGELVGLFEFSSVSLFLLNVLYPTFWLLEFVMLTLGWWEKSYCHYSLFF